VDVLIDTDTGMGTLGADPDDGLAIALALASPEVTVRAITCVMGNVPLDHVHANAAHLLQVLGRTDVPLAAGSERPLLHRPDPLRWLAERATWERVTPPAQPAGPSAAERILQTANTSEGLTIIAIGPLTNVAAALVAEPALVDRIERVVIMGGAFEVPGNVTPTAEFNCFMDPAAAQIVLDAGVNPVLVGLDVCHRTQLAPAQLVDTKFDSEFGRFVQDACAAWLPDADSDDGPYLYDSLTVAAALEPELLTLEPAFVQVEPGAGTSVAWLPDRPSAWSRPDRHDNALVATGVDVDAFAALFAERVLPQFDR
jgi:purine nucleosidase